MLVCVCVCVHKIAIHTVMEEQFRSLFLKQHPSHIVFTQDYQLTGSQSHEAPNVGFAPASRDLMT